MPELKQRIRVMVVHIFTQTCGTFIRKKCQMYEEKKMYIFTTIKLGKRNLSFHISRLS